MIKLENPAEITYNESAKVAVAQWLKLKENAVCSSTFPE